jgi:effector-binding domain-containing protein
MDEQPAVIDRGAQTYAGIPLTVTMASFASAVDTGFPELFGWLAGHGLAPAGPPFIRYHVVDMDGQLEVELGVPLQTAVTGDGRVRPGTVPGGNYATMVHTGPYDGLVAANAALQDWVARQGLVLDCSADQRQWPARLEYYLTDPRTEPDASHWQTEIAYRLKD